MTPPKKSSSQINYVDIKTNLWWSVSIPSFINIALLIKEKIIGVETTHPFCVTKPLKFPVFMEFTTRSKLRVQLQVAS